MAWHSSVAGLALLSLLVTACGGHGTPDTAGAPEGLIRFRGTSTDSSLTIAPFPGVDAIATRPIASVRLRVDDGAAQVLTQPTSTNPAGQPVYAFAVPARPCDSYRSYEITVTDVGGFSFTKYQAGSSCGAFSGLSDYGASTAQFRLASSGGTFGFSFGRDGADSYADTGYAAVAGDRLWSLPVREGDALYLSGAFTGDASDAAQATASIESGGTVLASLTVDRDRGGSVMVACCRGSAPSAVRHSVTLTVRPNGAPPAWLGFDAGWQVVRGGTGEIVRSFTGTGAGETSWTVDANEGDRLQLQVEVAEGVPIFAFIVADGRMLANMEGYAPGPIRLDVACCLPPRL